MPSFTTVFRAIVMLASAIIVVKGWQVYGPSGEQLKSFVARAIEIAQASSTESPPVGTNDSLAAEPFAAAPPLAMPLQPSIVSQPAGAAPSTAGTAPALHDPVAPPVFPHSAMGEPIGAAPEKTPAMPVAEADRLPALLARLEQLGGVEPQLVEWGSSGQLYRFCCRAALADTPSFSRHFESVAAEPLIAVEEVVAKVEAWRTAGRDSGSIQ